MRLLLDTQVFLWYISADSRLPVVFRDAIRDPANEVYLSAASIWEAVIKYALGKLPLPQAPAEEKEIKAYHDRMRAEQPAWTRANDHLSIEERNLRAKVDQRKAENNGADNSGG